MAKKNNVRTSAKTASKASSAPRDGRSTARTTSIAVAALGNRRKIA